VIRGIEGVVSSHDQFELGRFYLDPGYGRGTILFQWVRTGQDREGAPGEGPLLFARDDEPCMELGGLASNGPWVLLPPVSIRVDPPSANGTAFSTSFAAGMFAIEEGMAIVGADAGRGGFYWTPIDITTGRVVRPGHKWVAFRRWSLVVDEAGEEIPIVSFGEDPNP
jgi:hypothetical protein